MRPPVRLAAIDVTAMPTASIGHHARGARAIRPTDTPAAGHQKATDPDCGVNHTAQIPSR